VEWTDSWELKKNIRSPFAPNAVLTYLSAAELNSSGSVANAGSMAVARALTRPLSAPQTGNCVKPVPARGSATTSGASFAVAPDGHTSAIDSGGFSQIRTLQP
jgi:hypothetical protein